MKSLLKILFLSILIAVGFTACRPYRTVVVEQTPPPPPPPPPVSYQVFYDELSPFGQWVDYPGYGYVWIPNAGPGFRPYSNGHWVMTNYGWTWVSDYSWGWAPFHYGRWMFDAGYGSWIWIPGNVWGPAWVSWRQTEGYYGWAPLGPGVGVNVNIGIGPSIPAEHWVFVPRQFMTSPRVNNYYVNRQQNITIINNSTVINNTTVVNNNNYYAGPRANEVELSTHTRVTPVAIRENNRPEQSMESNGQLNVYRPNVQENIVNNNTNQRPAPARVVPLNNLKPAQQIPPVNSNNQRIENLNNEQPNQNRPFVENAQKRNESMPAQNTNPQINNPNTQSGNNRRNINNEQEIKLQPNPEKINTPNQPVPHNQRQQVNSQPQNKRYNSNKNQGNPNRQMRNQNQENGQGQQKKRSYKDNRYQ